MDGSVGATGRGGRIVEFITDVVTDPMFTGSLNRNGSRSSGAAPPESDGSSRNGREGLSGRHSSSNVTERLERTVLVEGK